MDRVLIAVISVFAVIVLLAGVVVPTGTAAATGAVGDTPLEGTLVVYYFHRTIRCEGCLQIENVARAAVARTFRREMRMGRVAWRSVNLDTKGNESFERRYHLQVQTLVLSEQVGRREVRWKRLDDAWDFQSDPVALDAYVVREVRAYLSADAFGEGTRPSAEGTRCARGQGLGPKGHAARGDRPAAKGQLRRGLA